MKIALVYNVFPGVSGETVFFDSMRKFLIPALREKGFSVDECPVEHLRYPVLSQAEFYSRFPLLLNARSMLKKYSDYDIVHFLNSSLAPAGSSLKKPRKIATVHLLGDSYRKLPPPEPAIERAVGSAFSAYSNFLDRGPMRKLDAIAACTPFQAEDLIETYSIDSGKVSIIPPGIDTDYFTKVPRKDLKTEYGCDSVLVYVGRLHERSKGVSYAIRAMKHLDDGYRLLLVGDGPDRKRYEMMVRNLGLEKCVVFLGMIGREEKSMIQKSADVALVPSLRDVFCTVFAESLACGVPVVAFEMPFWKGLYDDAAVYVERDPEALAAGIWKALEPETCRKITSHGMALARRYDVKNTVDSYTALYEELMAE
jgi:glycosyltransferase involved in cell wall biosynthesis